MTETTNTPQSSTPKPVVLKIGGNDIDSPEFLQSLAAYVAALDRPIVIVHGGGKEIGRLQAQMGIEAQWVDGLRVTDEATLSVVEMVLCGKVNKRLVRQLIGAGLDAAGMSGTDRGLLRGVKLHNEHGDLGRVHSADVMLVLSQSGETEEVTRLLPSLADFGVPIVAITARNESTLGRAATVTLELGPLEEACSLGLAPTTSTTAMPGPATAWTRAWTFDIRRAAGSPLPATSPTATSDSSSIQAGWNRIHIASIRKRSRSRARSSQRCRASSSGMACLTARSVA